MVELQTPPASVAPPEVPVPPATPSSHGPGARLALPLAAGVAVFLVNNFLLARVLTALPGGTLMAATDMAAVAFVVLERRRFGSVALIYAAYAALGVLGHLGVDASVYVWHLPRVLAAALAFDGMVALGGYRRWALVPGLLLFAGVLEVGGPLTPREWLIALALASGGLLVGVLAHELRRRLRRRR